MMRAADVMTTDVVMVKGSSTVAEAVNLMKSKQVRTLIVDRRQDSDPYGIVTEADMVYKVAAYGKDPKKMRVYEIMTKPCIVVQPELGIEYVARLFANTGIHRAPVIDGGQIRGIISLFDILHKSDFVESPKSVQLEEAIQSAIQEARKVTSEKGLASSEAAVAWDIVEELQAEAAHQKAEVLHKTAFEEYCEANPSAPEAKIYDN